MLSIFPRHEDGVVDEAIAVNSPRELKSVLTGLIDGLPFLGQPPYELTLSRKTPRSAYSGRGFRRRVLVSWLAGRPVSEVARRAGCSVRTVYNVIQDVIFSPEPSAPFAMWANLGLVAVMDGPAIEFDARGASGDLRLRDWELPVVCLVCHRIAAKVEWDEEVMESGGREIRRYDGSIILPGDECWDDAFNYSLAPQGHLVCHFSLDDDPVRLRPSGRWEFYGRVLGGQELIEEGRRRDRLKTVRQPWTESLDEAALLAFTGWRESGGQPLLPVRGGRPMREEEAARLWLNMLSDDRATDRAAAGRAKRRAGR